MVAGTRVRLDDQAPFVPVGAHADHPVALSVVPQRGTGFRHLGREPELLGAVGEPHDEARRRVLISITRLLHRSSPLLIG